MCFAGLLGGALCTPCIFSSVFAHGFGLGMDGPCEWQEVASVADLPVQIDMPKPARNKISGEESRVFALSPTILTPRREGCHMIHCRIQRIRSPSRLLEETRLVVLKYIITYS